MDLDLFKRFVVGSSLPVFILPALLSAVSKKSECEKTVIFYFVGVAFLFGLLNAILPLLVSFSEDPLFRTLEYATIGVIMGIFLAFINTQITRNGFAKMFGFKEKYNWMAFLMEPLIYGVIWAFVIPFMNDFMLGESF